MTTLEGNALRRAVAEEQGYSIEYHKNNRNHIMILDPNKQVVYGPTNAEFTHMVFKWATDEGKIPDYPNDLNTIEDAPLPDNYVVEIIRIGDSRMVRFHNSQLNDESFYALHPTKTATAFWNAWLEMRKAERDE